MLPRFNFSAPEIFRFEESEDGVCGEEDAVKAEPDEIGDGSDVNGFGKEVVDVEEALTIGVVDTFRGSV